MKGHGLLLCLLSSGLRTSQIEDLGSVMKHPSLDLLRSWGREARVPKYTASGRLSWFKEPWTGSPKPGFRTKIRRHCLCPGMTVFTCVSSQLPHCERDDDYIFGGAWCLQNPILYSKRTAAEFSSWHAQLLAVLLPGTEEHRVGTFAQEWEGARLLPWPVRIHLHPR